MKTYKLVAKFEDELNSSHVAFSAKNQNDADSKAIEWNRYHSHQPYEGYGYQVAQEDSEVEPKFDWFFN